MVSVLARTPKGLITFRQVTISRDPAATEILTLIRNEVSIE